MRTLLAVLVSAAVLGPLAAAQGGRGTIAGRVTDPDGPVPTADVLVESVGTEASYSTTTDQAGRFSLGVPAGTYEVSVPPLGFRTERFAMPAQVVEAGRTLTLEIELTLGNLGVPGDDAAFVAIRNRNLGVTGPTPRTADGRPDLSGMWLANVDPDPQQPALLPWADAAVKERLANAFRDLPTSRCLPDDPALTAPILYKIVQTSALLVFLHEAEPHYREVFLDGRGHPSDPNPTWLGHSIGTWEGDTLVIDSVGFNDGSWLTTNGFPHTDRLHIVERFRRIDRARMTHDVTYEDPATFVKPLEWRSVWQFAPKEELLESICTENNRYEDLVPTE